MPERKMVKVMFETNGSDWHGTTAERLWATPVGISLYCLENSPFCAYSVSYKDVVVAREDGDGMLRFERVESRGRPLDLPHPPRAIIEEV